MLNKKETRMNKHLFVWLFALFLGAFGADRFVRGQIGLGILKWIAAGILLGVVWVTIDWIIAIVKAYGGAYGSEKDIVFLDGKYAK